MTYPATQVRANAERLRVLHARIHATVKLRDRSAADRAVWQAACAAFHDQFGDLFFPGGEAAWSAFLASDAWGIACALVFLEVNEVTFRSGYRKQEVWERLKKIDLAPDDKRRLEDIALSYLDQRVRREFWHMVNFMRLRGTESFWQRVAVHADGTGPSAHKARWMLLARTNAPVRRWVGDARWRDASLRSDVDQPDVA